MVLVFVAEFILSTAGKIETIVNMANCRTVLGYPKHECLVFYLIISIIYSMNHNQPLKIIKLTSKSILF